MNPTQMTMEDMQLQVIRENIALLTEWLVTELEKQGYTVIKHKQYLTTREMCELAGINYSTWTKCEVRNDKDIVEMRDRYSTKAHQYHRDDVDKIKAIWIDYHKTKGGKQ